MRSWGRSYRHHDLGAGPQGRAANLDLLLELHAGGATIAVITHDREVADRLGRRVFIRDGRIEADVLPGRAA